jgi:hypothetical protein
LAGFAASGLDSPELVARMVRSLIRAPVQSCIKLFRKSKAAATRLRQGLLLRSWNDWQAPDQSFFGFDQRFGAVREA